jgi:hypothetical protein
LATSGDFFMATDTPNGLPTPDVCALVGAIAEAVDYRL